MRILRIGLAVIVVLVLAAAGYVWSRQQPIIPEVELPSRSAFDPALVRKGAQLAAIGNCHACHTNPGGADFAGNRPIATPFGIVYSTNITPAPGSGIGHWSETAFRRALREGVSRRGNHLYPVFPYDHFARLGNGDIRALYAFLMTRRPVETYRKANELVFPFNQRWLINFWNLLFFHPAPSRPAPQRSAEWNRGAYLVSGLGHCGDCHTPRNLFGAEEAGRALAGGEAEGWTAPALTGASSAPVPRHKAHLFAYLRNGRDAAHGAAAGPMRVITDDLAQADDADVRAIAVYLATLQGEASPGHRERTAPAREQATSGQAPKPAAGQELGAAIFAGACARCHVGGPSMVPPRGIDLSLSTAIGETDPRDAIQIVLGGIEPQGEQAGPIMPRFGGALTDAQIAALLTYIRAEYGAGPAWTDLEAKVRQIRHSKGRS